MSIKQDNRIKRHRRIRKKINGTIDCPRFCVFRSNKHIHLQLIDDEKGKVLLSVSDKDIKSAGKKVDVATAAGQLIAEKALGKKIERVSFDRGGYKYHGRIKAIADGARKGGLKF